MNKPIQLIPGLFVKFGEDGTWLHFEGDQHKSGVCLQLLLKDSVAWRAFKEWDEQKRNAGGLWA